MKLKVFQKGFNYSQDGPGNRLVYHLQGCNMRCPWCSNPEGMFAENPLRTKLKPILEYEPQDFVNEARSCKPMFFDGGGVTFTGGEPTLNFDALEASLAALKQNGFDTALESNATHKRLKELFPYTDRLIMDFKHYDREAHIKITGLDNDTVKENIAAALKEHGDVLIRTVLVRGVNDSEKDAVNFAEFYKRFDTSHARFEFLPYHEYGKAKWEQCGREYTMRDAFVSEETVNMFIKTYNSYGLKTVRT